MKSWVRYSVAVYFGLLMAGSMMPSPQAIARPRWNEPPAQATARALCRLKEAHRFADPPANPPVSRS